MADLTTIVLSVGTTLLIQSGFHLVIQYPYQLHQVKAKLAELALREQNVYLAFTRAQLQLTSSMELLGAWELISNPSFNVEVRRKELGDFIRKANKQRGQLAGVILGDDQSGQGRLIQDVLDLLDISVRISQDVLDTECDFLWAFENHSSELTYLKERIRSRLAEVSSRLSMGQGIIRHEMALLDAEVNNLGRRTIIAATALGLLVGAAQFIGIDFLLRRLTSGFFVRAPILVISTLAVSIALAWSISRIMASAHDSADVKLLENLLNQAKQEETELELRINTNA